MVDQVHLTTNEGTCDANMDEICVFKANGVKAYVVVACD
jgi:hypothetical protein